MAITVGYDPIQSIGGAAIAAGNADYKRWLAQYNLQQQQQAMEAQRLAAQQQQQQFDNSLRAQQMQYAQQKDAYDNALKNNLQDLQMNMAQQRLNWQQQNDLRNNDYRYAALDVKAKYGPKAGQADAAQFMANYQPDSEMSAVQPPYQNDGVTASDEESYLRGYDYDNALPQESVAGNNSPSGPSQTEFKTAFTPDQQRQMAELDRQMQAARLANARGVLSDQGLAYVLQQKTKEKATFKPQQIYRPKPESDEPMVVDTQYGPMAKNGWGLLKPQQVKAEKPELTVHDYDRLYKSAEASLNSSKGPNDPMASDDEVKAAVEQRLNGYNQLIGRATTPIDQANARQAQVAQFQTAPTQLPQTNPNDQAAQLVAALKQARAAGDWNTFARLQAQAKQLLNAQ